MHQGTRGIFVTIGQKLRVRQFSGGSPPVGGKDDITLMGQQESFSVRCNSASRPYYSDDDDDDETFFAHNRDHMLK